MIPNLSNFALFLIAFAGITSTGRITLYFFKIRLTPGERLVYSFVLGAFAVFLAIMVLGFAGLITKTAAYIVLGAGLLAILYRPKNFVKETAALYRSIRRFVRSIKGTDQWVALIIIAELTVVFFIVAFGPEVRFDGLAYHLELPKRYIEAGRIQFYGDVHQSAFPALWDMAYVYGLLLRSEQISRLFAFTVTLCLVHSIYSFGRRLFGKSTGLFAALVASTAPIISAYWSNAMADNAFALFLLLSLTALTVGRKKILTAAFAAGVFLAFAAASRMQTFVLAPALAVVFIGTLTALRINRRKGFLTIVILSALSIVVAAPWYIHNYSATGNIFGYVSTALVRIENWSGASRSNSFVESVWVYLSADNYRGPHGPWYIKFAYPFLLTFKPWLWSDGEFGPLFLALIPAGFFAIYRKKTVLSLFSLIFIIFLSWIILLKEVNLRYLVWGIPYASLIAGYTWTSFSRLNRAGKFLSLFLVSITAVIGGYFTYRVHEYFPVVLGARPSAEFVDEKKYGGFDAIEVINALPEGSKILSLEPQVFYFEKPTVIGFPRHNLYFDTSRIGTPGEMLEWLQNNGITHVFTTRWASEFRFPGKPYGRGAEGYVFRKDVLETYGVLIAEGGKENVVGGYYELYEMHYPEPKKR
jgi:hypothetical protein